MKRERYARSPPRGPGRRWHRALALGAAAWLAAASASGEEALSDPPGAVTGSGPASSPGTSNDSVLDPDPGAGPSPGGQGVELEQLLQLPDTFEVGGERRGGATSGEWRSRFKQARDNLETARSSLKEVQAKLENTVEDSAAYSVTAPGASDAAANSPVSFALRQELRRLREDVAREERSLRALEIEADLADVPEPWRR